MVKNLVGEEPSEEELDTMMKEVDEDGSGEIEFNEFLALMAKRSKFGVSGSGGEDWMEAFKVFDKDGDGYISPGKLQHVMVNLGENMSTEEVHEMVMEADLDGDGLINFDEFVKMMVHGVVLT